MDQIKEAITKINLGIISRKKGDLEEAISLHQEAYKILEAKESNIIIALVNLGQDYYRKSEIED